MRVPWIVAAGSRHSQVVRHYQLAQKEYLVRPTNKSSSIRPSLADVRKEPTFLTNFVARQRRF
jgi:hypothetical protein